VDHEFAAVQVGPSPPDCPGPPHSKAGFDESDIPMSLDDPLLETCKRELEAVLASLGPETS
jgi:hypothetical protein